MVQKKMLCVAFLLLLSINAYAMVPNTVVATMNTGVNPTSIAITPDNRFAYVTNNNFFGVQGGNSVSVLNLETNTVETVITNPNFNQPFSVVLNPNGTRAYVTNSNGTTVSILDTATNTVTGTINGFEGPSGIALLPNSNFAYVTNYGLGAQSGNARTVRVVNLNTNMIVGAPIPVGQAPNAVVASPNGSFIYTLNYGNGAPGAGTISVIDPNTNTVVHTISGFSGPFSAAITPDNRFAYVTNFGNNNFSSVGSTVSVVDLMSNSIVDTINVGIQPSGIALSPDGRFAYVTNYNTLFAGPNDLVPGQGTVSIIDLQTNTVVSPTIPVGQSPSAIAVSPNNEFAFVTNTSGNTVDAIALQSFQLMGRGCQIKHKKTVINQLVWRATGLSLPVSYTIYRDAALTDVAASIPATQPLRFLDRNREPNVEHVYYLVGINEAGTRSEPLAITVMGECNNNNRI